MPDDEPRDSGLISGARYAGFGFEFAATIVAGVLVGNYLDQWLGTSPWLLLLFTLGAMVGAVQRLISSLKRHSSREADRTQ
ncbi:MAG TPA: AtpZ/AtpI family protein [Candidatus Binatia bacterium]|nr:AtpZ/AtpI family protein [Candidatus Binatia bacterium]